MKIVSGYFFRVVDHYGDIGFSWRLAKQLSKEYSWKIRIWVDNLWTFSKIQFGVIINSNY